MNLPNPVSDFSLVNSIMNEAITAKVIMAAVDMNLFDKLEGRSMDLPGLAESLNVVAERLEPFVEILVALELLEKSGSSYGNTPVAAEYLVSSAPLYQGDYLALTIGYSTMLEGSIIELLRGGSATGPRVPLAGRGPG